MQRPDAARAVQRLDLSDCIALGMQKTPDINQNLDVARAVKPPTPCPLHRTNEGELRFPEPQNMLRDADFVGGFRNGSESIRPFHQS
jgi:hypothetical protein